MALLWRWMLGLGPANPIAVRLVQNGSRRARHMYIRAAYLGLLIVVLLYALLAFTRGDELSYQQLALAGSNSFKYIAYLQIALICILAPVFMAGAIAQESDPKTWDILLTTPLSPGQIVLGNLLGRLFFILALLGSSLPLFAITQYFGGVPGSTIFASYLIAACAAVVVGAMAIALSVSRLVGKRAVFAFYIGVVSYLVVTWALDGLLGGGRVSWMTALNPFLSLHALLDPVGYPRVEGAEGFGAWFLGRPVTTWCVLSLALSLGLTVASVLTVRVGGFAAITGGGGAGGDGSKVPWYRKALGLGAAGADTRPARAVWNQPIAWREAAARNATLGRILARYAFIAAGLVFALVLIGLFHAGTLGAAEFRAALFYTLIGELAVIALVAVNMSATTVAREREDGTLDLLLTTPITPGVYLGGKLKGVIAYLLPMLMVPVGTLLLAGAYVLAGGLGRAGGVGIAHTFPAPTGRAAAAAAAAGTPTGPVTLELPVVLPEAGLVVGLVAVPFVAFCVIVGLQFSLKSRGTLGSVASAVGVVGAIAGTIGLCAWQAGKDLPVVGPVLSALGPASAVMAGLAPEQSLSRTISQSGLTAARIGLLSGALGAALIYGVAVYLVHASMVRTFDMTVRRLAGMR
jgi:ABC-type transport system involved in multi-copper enzyme maturation permease subunit